MSALLEVRGLIKRFPAPGGLEVTALAGIDLDLEPGECLAVVGESGSGKSTLGRIVMCLERPDGGLVRFRGEPLTGLSGRALRRLRRGFQMVFQDPFGSLNPRMRVGAAIREPLAIHRVVPRSELDERVVELLDLVGLPASIARRFPHELSGGQRQRVGIARAIAPGPDLLVADEPVSSLDVSVQAQVLNLLQDLRSRLGLAMLFVSHDLAVVERIADRVAVMYAGRIVEEGPTRRVLGQPRHPYTVSLLSAVPEVDPERRRHRIVLPGEPPGAGAEPSGCPFHPRCPTVRTRCRSSLPELAPVDGGGAAACFYPGQLASRGGTAGRGRESP